MAAKKNPIKTRPYKTITIDIHPDFVPRLQTNTCGIKNRGVTSALAPCAYMAFLFEVNEYLPKNHKLTDFQIAKAIANEYPHRPALHKLLDVVAKRIPSTARLSVCAYRSYYNKGTLLVGKPRGGPISFRYNSDGDRLSNRRTGKLLEEKEYGEIIARYGLDTRSTQDFDWSFKLVELPKNKGGRPCYKSFDWCI